MNNNTKTKPPQKLKWETSDEYKYRIVTGEIFTETAKVLRNIETMVTNKKNIVEAKTKLMECEKKLDRLNIPKRYFAVNGTIENCLNAYIRGINLLGGVNDSPAKDKVGIIHESGLYISEGTSWFTITKVRMHEAIKDINEVNA